MSEKNQVLFGILGVALCLVAACVIAGIRATGSWEGFRTAFSQRLHGPARSGRPADVTQPATNALSFIRAELDPAFTNLLAYARDGRLSSYEPIPGDDWPLEIKALRPLNVRYFNNSNQPDAEGIFFVLEVRRGCEVGVLRAIERTPDRPEPGPDQIVLAEPDRGFRKLTRPGCYWHWIQSAR